ncbi:hypothetical protein ANCDUO_00403 [Ancylostoma duodenale]|uniref:Uncharacterized protein n=1 Tax=Ancylostoma duodenale TaxID=51022 RepID=A0A0C2E1K6_9BILA|nr:hypothetical protein ANCDUO_00403 [Ancylostoma duodenale]
MLNFRIGTINCRTLPTENRIAELEDAITEIPHDIIGLSGTQRTGSMVSRLQKFKHFISLTELTGFVVNKKWTDCCSFRNISKRVSFIDFKYTHQLLLIHEEYEEFLEHITQALNTRTPGKTYHKIVVGDFNAKVVSGSADEEFIGPYGLGVRNEIGEALLHFCSETRLHLMNNRFQKKASRKWTWISPNMKTRIAIDFVSSVDPSIFLDVDIIGRFNFVSDHRLVMAKTRLKKKRHFFKKPQQKTTLNEENFSSALQLSVTTKLSNYEVLKEDAGSLCLINKRNQSKVHLRRNKKAVRRETPPLAPTFT